jgi:hypothetical protein
LLVGDLVQAIREAVTDQCGVLATPSLVSVVPYQDANGTWAPGTYFAVLTVRTPWGETNISNEITFTITAPNNAVHVNYGLLGSAIAFGGSLQDTRFFVGSAAGAEVVVFVGPVSNPFNVIANPVAQTVLPTRNTAYLPDTDGDAINAASLFRWMNDALKLASQVCGGLLDYGGLSTVSGVPQYITPGQWSKISTLWYDGYPLAMDDSGNYFRRNTITASILASVATSMFTDRMMLEVWPQPSRTAAQTTLAVAMAATDTQATLNSVAGFLLTDGFVNINGELMSYNGIQGNILKNLLRGLGGSSPSAQVINAPVNELNVFWQGWRKYAPNFQPGDSLKTVPAPIGWETQLFKYGLGRAKLAEQGVGDFTKLEQDFVKSMNDWFKSNKVTTGPRQIGEQSDGLQTLPSFGGGWVLPVLFL